MMMATIMQRFMELEEAQKREFPEYIFKNIADLQKEYISLSDGDLVASSLISSFMDSTDAYLPYMLPEGTCNSSDGYQCVGIRYGVEPHEYISLPQIKIK
jgi:hypothetical protein